MAERDLSPRFPTTRWSMVSRAVDPEDPAASLALDGLCGDYWYPLYVLVRHRGLDHEDAGDLIQGFLADLIERRSLEAVDASRGRFRSFLCSACLHYLSRRRDHDRSLKRGGGRRRISIDLLDAEGRYGREPSHDLTAEKLFERRWALVLLGLVLQRLEAEASASGKSALFVRLRPLLEGDDRADSYRRIGQDLGMTEGAVKVAAHRFRGRYRSLLREEIARTVADPSEVDAEIASLLASLA